MTRHLARRLESLSYALEPLRRNEERTLLPGFLCLMALGEVVAALMTGIWTLVIPATPMSLGGIALLVAFAHKQRRRFAFSERRLGALSEQELWALGLMTQGLGEPSDRRDGWFCDIDLAGHIGQEPMMDRIDLEKHFEAQHLIQAAFRAGLLERKPQAGLEFGRRFYRPLPGTSERQAAEQERRDESALRCEPPGRASRPSALAS